MNAHDWFPLINSLRIAAVASVIVFFLGIGCAHWAARLPRAVKGVPSEKRTSSRRWKVQVFPEADSSQLSARQGWGR